LADSTRETILDALYTCLAGITLANGYAIGVQEVKRGIHLPDAMPNRPSLGYANTRATRKDYAAGQSERALTILVYGYVDVTPGVYDNLDDLMQAVEQRLMTSSAWAYRDDTFINSFTIYEGGVHDPIGYFDMEVVVNYEYAMASP
jgi:hypothetical protein